MITHIVFFKLLDPRPDSIAQVRDMLMGMQGKIPQLAHIEAGADLVRSPRSCDLALLTKFDSLEDLEAYQVHPVHVEVSQYLSTVREFSFTVDYETPNA